jgi:hypothetical protein
LAVSRVSPADITLGLAVRMRMTPIEDGPVGEGSLTVSLLQEFRAKIDKAAKATREKIVLLFFMVVTFSRLYSWNSLG